MTDLSDFLKVKQVRCVKAYGDCLTVGKEYSVLNIRMEVEVRDDEGGRYYWESDYFEPVLDSAENPLQGVELTPEFEAVEPTFKVGDKVYKYGETDVKTVLEVFEDGHMRISKYPYRVNHEVICHATQENYEMLCNIYPHIEFEQPPKPLTGSDLARAMLDKGHEYVVGRVGNHVGVYYTWSEGAGHFFEVCGTGTFDIEPINPKTGEPLTEAVLDE